ncbi:MAG: hypothetical protein H6557_29350 [Lewinellaceae bacterium]|nr:hypothetical protein [Phaeodactylibacter sp.]MCB9040754.1 hypothetical protein [Lewinellaceae bacterium]
MPRLCFFLFLWSLGASVSAQESAGQQPEGRYHSIGLNASPLLVQVAPFNRSNPKVLGPYFITYRVYTDKDRAFRLALGWDVDASLTADEAQNHFNFRMGLERRRQIADRWSYSMAWDMAISGGDFNLPGEKDVETGFIGLGPTWGFEFFINRTVSLSTEVSLWLGLDTNEGIPRLQVVPPVALLLNVWRPRKKK